FAPTDRTVTSTQVHGATFTWNAGASPNVEWIVVANGGTPASPVLATGTSTTGTATATGLTANTQYSAFFRGLCDDQGTGDDPSAWSDPGLNFRTQVGCGGPYNIFYRPSGNVAPFDSVMTICPDNAGDVVTYTVNGLNLGSLYQGTALFVYNGPDVNAEMFNSGLTGYTSGANSIPAGGYYGSTYLYYPPSNGNINNLPAPFTSSHASGCLTVRFRSVQIDTYYNKPVLGSVTCAPAPACSTPNAVSFSAVGSSNATVSWGNTSEPCVIEYGPAGFIPGTGATAGAGTVASTSATSPYTITGLNPTTTYEVRIRQVCSGPSYSANSFFARFTTSMDCSTAQVLACGEYVDDANAPEAYTMGVSAYDGDKYTNAVTCFSGSAAEGNGPERLYRFTATQAGTYAIQAGTSDMGGASTIKFVMAPVEDGCAASAFTCIGKPAANAGGLLNFTVSTPGDYYIMSDANYGVHKRPFTLMCPGIPPCVPAPTFPANGTTLAVNTTPIAFSWPAAFGATGYDVYFNGSLVVANYPGTSITDGSYNTANMLNWPGVDLGSTLSWHVVPTNSFGTASCPTTWTFSIGGNGASNAIPLTDGIAVAGNTSATNGYSSLNGSFWGNDSWSSFTASDCADSAVVNLCLPANEPANYVALQIIRASDNAVVFPPADDPGYYAYVASGACFQYEWFNDDPEVWNWVNETPKIKVDIGETYYVIADGYNSGYNFTVGYNEISNSPDSDEDGIPDCADNCPFMPGVVGDVCDAGPGFATGRISSDCECVGGNMAVISITTDGNPDQITWQITNETSLVVASGGPAAAQANTTVNETVFLAGSCYGFQLMDSFGDGIVNGGWELRTTNGKVILRDSFNGGSASPANPAQSPSYGSSHSFCLPLAAPDVHPAECGVFDNRSDNKVFANKVAGTNYQGGTLNYQFEFSDPDSGYVRRIKKPRNYVVFSELNPGPLKGGKHYFTRVRTDKAGPVADAHWGAGCEMGLGTTVNCTQLIEAPTYGHSCNEVRRYGPSSFIYAQPVFGATQYEFRIFNTGEGYDETYVRNTYILELNGFANPLQDGFSYQVQVRARVSDTWGSYCGTCSITINNDQQILQNSLVQVSGEATLWPNPARDGQVYLNIDGIEAATQQITVDVKDIYGQQVYGQAFGNSGERFSTVLNLPA
ncbi:MAG: fibronectin type III domain-containing protein, partial [Flavobacteriales bacterium]|nr:fibronectin type III domain-containing protein [Flavobacteriales bacterium]